MSGTNRSRRVWGGARAVLLAVCAWTLTAPSEANAQGTPYPENQPFTNASGTAASTRRPGQGLDLSVSLYTGVHFAGRERRDDGTLSVDSSLAPAFAAGFRLELATSRYFAVGAFLDYARTQIVFALPDLGGDVTARTGLVGVGVSMKFSVPVVIASTDVRFYVGVPLGLSILRAAREPGASKHQGWVLGAWAGVHVALTEHVGVFADGGFRVNLFSQTDDLDEYARLTLLQGMVHVGASYSF